MAFGSGRGASLAPGCNDDRRAWLTNITVRDSVFTRTNRGVRIKTRANATNGPGCHGRATQILYQNLRMVDVNTTISAIMHYPCADVRPGPECWVSASNHPCSLLILQYCSLLILRTADVQLHFDADRCHHRQSHGEHRSTPAQLTKTPR
jgi:hypothetical protein